MHSSGMGETGGVVDWYVPVAGQQWKPIDPRSGEVVARPLRLGVVSWGPGGDFFNSWETSRGAFGFRTDGRGVEFTGPLAGIAALDSEVHEAFTDFAASKPWVFQPLAFTQTRRRILYPDLGERYPCVARIVNMQSGGEFILVAASVAQTGTGLAVLEELGINLK